MRHPRRDAACNTSEVEDMMANLCNFLLLFGPVGPYPVGMVMICRTNRIGDGLLQYQGGNLPRLPPGLRIPDRGGMACPGKLVRRPNDLTDIRPPDSPGHAVEDHVGHGDLPGHRFTTGFVVNILGQAFDIPDVPASAGIRIWGGSVFTPYPYFCLISPDDFHRGNGGLDVWAPNKCPE